ncbi:MAG: DUF389 domain-containing protein [Bacteroidales bacterium]|nr:DUF389 domain-containing protein [Bacteroidales bacterium]
MNKFNRFFKILVNMSDDLDLGGAEANIRRNIYFRGATVFILICAIIIASLGLNVNSIPVVIGAMLISPVMGPNMGFGFGLATRDYKLLKDSLKNFGVMVAISIIASALFFILSPLELENPTELLARTNPTIYDVLIALFGGTAGMLEVSRNEKGTVLSGVAIATALMPPLCTVGYGISVLNLTYIFGALYLFTINSIFIALATFLVAKYLKYPIVPDTGGAKRRLKSSTVAIILIVIIIPSIISAIQVIKENNFNMHATRLISENKTIGSSFIYDYKIDNKTKPSTIEMFMAGDILSDIDKEILFSQAEKHGIMRNQIIIRENASRQPAFETELIRGIYEHTDMQINSLNATIDSLRTSLHEYENKAIPDIISKELTAQYPSITKIILSRGNQIETASGTASDQVVALLYNDAPLDEETIKRIENWLKVRLDNENVMVLPITEQK